jgi:hypothetical protein
LGREIEDEEEFSGERTGERLIWQAKIGRKDEAEAIKKREGEEMGKLGKEKEEESEQLIGKEQNQQQ